MNGNPHQHLKQSRLNRGLTLKSAAQLLECHLTQLSRIENGLRPSRDLALSIEKVFGIPPQAWARSGRAA